MATPQHNQTRLSFIPETPKNRVHSTPTTTPPTPIHRPTAPEAANGTPMPSSPKKLPVPTTSAAPACRLRGVHPARRFFLELTPRTSNPSPSSAAASNTAPPDYYLPPQRLPLYVRRIRRPRPRFRRTPPAFESPLRRSPLHLRPRCPTHAMSATPHAPSSNTSSISRAKKPRASPRQRLPHDRPGHQTSAPNRSSDSTKTSSTPAFAGPPISDVSAHCSSSNSSSASPKPPSPSARSAPRPSKPTSSLPPLYRKHYRIAAGLADIAADCNIDPAYLCRLFKRFDYQSPWQYVIQLKMRPRLINALQMPQALIKPSPELRLLRRFSVLAHLPPRLQNLPAPIYSAPP